MPRTLQEIVDHADEIAQQFEDYEPKEADRRAVGPLLRARNAVQARAQAELAVAEAVKEMRDADYSWSAIGGVLGTSAEAARQRYGPSAPAKTRTRTRRNSLGLDTIAPDPKRAREARAGIFPTTPPRAPRAPRAAAKTTTKTTTAAKTAAAKTTRTTAAKAKGSTTMRTATSIAKRAGQ